MDRRGRDHRPGEVPSRLTSNNCSEARLATVDSDWMGLAADVKIERTGRCVDRTSESTSKSHYCFTAEGGTYDLRLQRSRSANSETLSVKVPACIDTGSVIRLTGQGEPGSKLRLKGKGILNRRTGSRRDMFAVIRIVAPKDLNDQTRRLLEQLQQHPGQNAGTNLWTELRYRCIRLSTYLGRATAGNVCSGSVPELSLQNLRMVRY